MIYIKPLSGILLLVCLLSMVFAQAPTVIESNSTSLIPIPTESLSNSSSAIISSTTSTPSSPSTFIISSPTLLSSTSKSIQSSTTTTINPIPTVQTTGWDSNGNSDSGNQQSWLRQNNRFVFVIFLGLLFLAILIWYIVRSIKGMRKRLEQENQAQLYMMQQAGSPQPPRNDRVIPELTQTPPPTYKNEEHPSAQPQQNNDHSRY